MFRKMLGDLGIYLMILVFCFGSIIIFLLPFAFLQLQYAIVTLIAIVMFYRIRFPFEFSGNFRTKSIFKSSTFNFMAAQQPWKTIYSTELDITKKYMFNLTPHGMYPISWMIFATHLASIDCFPLFLMGDIVFRVPLTREMALLMGAVNASWKSVKIAAAKDKSVLLISGGAREMIYSGRSKGVIHIVKRTAFLRAALMYGYTLVPVVGVGVDELYRAYILPWEWCKRLTGVYPFLPLGKFDFISPRDANVYHVVGEPIPVSVNENPSEKDIEELKGRYYQGLEAALEYYNKKYCQDVKIEYIEVEKKQQTS